MTPNRNRDEREAGNRDGAGHGLRLLLVAPAAGPWRGVGRFRWFNGRTFRFSLLSLLRVAGETPPPARITVVDEQVEDVPWDGDFDLVGITCMTALAPRAYEIAAQFRRRGIPVVLGGMHPTLCPEDAAGRADAIVVGEAEGIWGQVVADAQAGRLRPVYRRETPSDLRGLTIPRRGLLNTRAYATLHAVEATRGCPNGCDFCAVAAAHRRSHRCRPVEEVVAEVRRIPTSFFLFVDDNLTADRRYARALFEQLAPLRKRWVAQVTLDLAEDEEMVRLAASAGCRGVFVGLETFGPDNLVTVGKGFNRVERYREVIRRFQSHGIRVEAGIVFGLPGDDRGVFRRTLDQLEDLGVDAIQVSIFTPLPGTPRHRAWRDRIFDRDWAHYDFHRAVFRPIRMSAEELQAGHDWVTREFYRPWRMARRVGRLLRCPAGWAALPFYLAVNLAYYGRVVRWGIRGWDPGRTAVEKGTKDGRSAVRPEPPGEGPGGPRPAKAAVGDHPRFGERRRRMRGEAGSRTALGLVAESVIDENQGGHGFDHGDGARQDARVMPTPALQGRVLESDIHGVLIVHNGCHRLEGDPEMDRLAVADAALDAPGTVGHRANPAVDIAEGVVVLESGQEDAPEAAADLEAFRGG